MLFTGFDVEDYNRNYKIKLAWWKSFTVKKKKKKKEKNAHLIFLENDGSVHDAFFKKLRYWNLEKTSQPAFSCSNSTMETLEECEICSELTIKTLQWYHFAERVSTGDSSGLLYNFRFLNVPIFG